MKAAYWWIFAIIPWGINSGLYEKPLKIILFQKEQIVSEQYGYPEELLRNIEGYLRDRNIDVNLEEYLRSSEENASIPLPERRGIEHIDRNSLVILARVPLDQLSDTLAIAATETHRDIVGREIELPNLFAFAYQIAGHEWSIIVWDTSTDSNNDYSGIVFPPILEADELSLALEESVIVLSISGSGGDIGYRVFENGEITEYFYGIEGEVENCLMGNLLAQKYVLSPYADVDPEAQNQTACFWSSRRQLTTDEIESIWRFPNQIMHELGAYDPAINPHHFLGTSQFEKGGRYMVRRPEHPDRDVEMVLGLVRVDFFGFEK